jgi:putative phage-type endonuclease
MKSTGIKRSDDLEKWLEFRRKHVTASDAAAIMGVSPFATPLAIWMEKTGRKQSKDQEDRAHLDWGNRLERVALDWVSDEIGETVLPTDEIFVHDRHDWLSCTPDGFFDLDPKTGLTAGYVEVKAPSAWVKDQWQHGMPEHYMIQCQLGMEITGLKHGVMAAVIHPRLYWGRIEHDERIVARILDACYVFWTEHVLRDIPPEVTGASKEAGFIKELHPKDTGKVVNLNEEDLAATRRLAYIDQIAAPLLTEKKELTNSIKMNIGSASYGVLPDGGVWSWTCDSRGARRLTQVKSVPNLKGRHASEETTEELGGPGDAEA